MAESTYETPLGASLRLTATKMSPELVETFYRLVAEGNYYIAACEAVGISYATFRSWMAQGKVSSDDNDPFRAFYLLIREADSLAEQHAVRSWRKHFSRDYRAARDFLARRYPQRWAEQQRLTVAVDSEVQRMLEILQGELDPVTYSKVIQGLAMSRAKVLDAADEIDDDLDDFLGGEFDFSPRTTVMDQEEV